MSAGGCYGNAKRHCGRLAWYGELVLVQIHPVDEAQVPHLISGRFHFRIRAQFGGGLVFINVNSTLANFCTLPPTTKNTVPTDLPIRRPYATVPSSFAIGA